MRYTVEVGAPDQATDLEWRLSTYLSMVHDGPHRVVEAVAGRDLTRVVLEADDTTLATDARPLSVLEDYVRDTWVHVAVERLLVDEADDTTTISNPLAAMHLSEMTTTPGAAAIARLRHPMLLHGSRVGDFVYNPHDAVELSWRMRAWDLETPEAQMWSHLALTRVIRLGDGSWSARRDLTGAVFALEMAGAFLPRSLSGLLRTGRHNEVLQEVALAHLTQPSLTAMP